MFGQKSSGFGGGFGTTPSSFGTAAPFGQSNNTFSAKPAGTTGFGTPAFGTQTPASGGLFGGSAQQSTGGLFGQTQPGSFGQQTSGGFSFGSTPSTSSGLFGQTQTQSTGGLFSTPASSTAFGSKTPGFGGFGATTSSTGLFGGTTSSTTSLFGQTSSVFGSASSSNGTTVKFNPPSGQDTMMKNGVTANINTRHQCITAMKEYDAKSLEELRLEDYQANRKGKQQGASGGLFGSAPATQQSTGFTFGQQQPTATGFGTTPSASSGGLFGQQNQQQAGGLFGQSKPLFGGATTSTSNTGFGFGANTNQTTSLFGQSQQKTLFGTTPATTQSSLFGTNASTFGQTGTFGTPGFGTQNQTPAGSLFGSKPTGLGTATTQSTGFGFGTGSNLFAKPTSTPSYGFGTQTSAAGFGGAGGGLFGAKPQGFGTAPSSLTTGTGSFNFGGGLASGTTGGLFGGNQSKPNFGFNFGGGTATTGPAFGGGLTGGGSTGFALGGNAPTLGTTTTSVSSTNPELHQQLLALASSPFGDSPLFWNLKQNSAKREEVLKPTNPAAQKAALTSSSQYKVSPRPTAKIRPKSLHSLMNGGKAQLFDGLEDEDFSFGNDTFMPRKSVKKLVLKKAGDSGATSHGTSQTDENPDLTSLEQDMLRTRPITRTLEHDLERAGQNSDTESIIRSKNITDPIASSIAGSSPIKDRTSLDDTIAMLNNRNRGLSGNISSDKSKSVDERDPETYLEEQQNIEPAAPHPTGIVLTRPGYYSVPKLDELVDFLDENGDCFVDDFTIGREGYGSLFFPGVTNVAGLNLDETVHFRRKEVVVYPDDDKKPQLGEGLNKKAEVTLDCVWPSDKTTRSPIKSPQRLKVMNYQEKIEEITAKIGGKFIDYRPETGSWTFEVKHFSKYGLLDDSEEEDLSEQEKKRLKLSQQQQLAIQKQKILQQEQQKLSGGAGQDPVEVEPQGLSGRTTPHEKDRETVAYPHPIGIIDDDEDADMPDITTEKFPGGIFETSDEMTDLKGETGLPSSHRLASSMGVSAQSMQVMKASFFGDDLEDEGKGKLASFYGQPASLLKHPEKTLPSLFSPALKSKYSAPLKLSQSPQPQEMQKEFFGFFSQKLVTPEVRRPHQSFVHPPLAEHMLLSSGIAQHDIPRKIVGSRMKRDIPPVTESLMYQKQALLIDAGCFMGRSFRVGWGPGWTLAHSGLSAGPEQKEQPCRTPFSLLHSMHSGGQVRAGGKAWSIKLEKLNVAEYFTGHDKTVVKNHEDMLEIQLENSQRHMENGCPLFVPEMGVEALHNYAEQCEQSMDEVRGHPDESSMDHIRMVWNLCVALWGNLPEFRYCDTEDYAVCQARREAFSRWLSATAEPKIQQEVQDAKFKKHGYLAAVFSYLSGRLISEASDLSQKSGDHRLALLLAQAVGSHVPRQMLARQLEEWAELDANHFIQHLRLKIYSLISGQLVWRATGTVVNTCENLDWKRALALHLWFHCKPNAAVHEGLNQYEEGFKGRTSNRNYCSPPLPPYLEQDHLGVTEEEREDDSDDHAIRDTCYHLLKLYCQKAHRLERLLNPTTSTANQLDYRLSWHLSQVLQALSYCHLSPYHWACIHTNFAAQLEALGMWEWAVFAVLHIDDVHRRENAVRCLLGRHISLSRKSEYLEKEEFIEDKLLVPAVWIHHAKALKARTENRYSDEAWHLLKACQWNEGHQVILHHIAADSIINENYGYLKQYLEELSPPERSSSVLNWNTGGKVFLDYINLCQKLEELKQGEPSPYDLEKLQPEVTSLCSRVGGLTCHNSKERLCQSEMAKKSANLLRTLLTLQTPDSLTGRPPTRLLASHISNLPMPEDYSLQELRELTRSYLLEMTI